VRARSRDELRWRLLRAGYEAEETDAALADLERVGLIDDERFARDLAAHEIHRRSAGRRAALASLRKHGVSRDLAERAVDEADPGDEEDRALEVARARAGRLGGLDTPTAYRRLLGFLERRGYGGEAARAAARKALEEADASS
jgi:regulatory protein